MIGRIVIDDIHPRTPSGRYPAKVVVGETVRVTADVFKDGHDILGARVRWRACSSERGHHAGGVGSASEQPPAERQALSPAGRRTAERGQTKWEVAAMRPLNPGLDLWGAELVPTTIGRHEIVVEAWHDEFETWRHKAEVKLAAGQDIAVELEEGARLAEHRASQVDAADRGHLLMVATALRDGAASQADRLAPAVTETSAALLGGPHDEESITTSDPVPLWVDRERALVGAWYELFPRSYGGFAGVREHLQYVADLGFDVVYLPPIHPIGRTFRKGANNSLEPRPDDVGSPWAIGSDEGGHTAIEPSLGTFTDFDDLVRRAGELGMEIALDYALQCSPDHPWVKDHPEWFHHRPDGSIAYAENPPKKYQDIFPINFWPQAEEDRRALWEACKDILDFWIAKGVRIFRVDNPHTKPMAFWEWVIPAVQDDHPDVLFLAEAFTRPKVMSKLAEVGFTQSYTYFTWRTTARDLMEYAEEVALSPKADFMRPSFWPNTPDILSGPLRNGTPAAFRLRFLLAATLVPTYGVYSGYELIEAEPMSDTNEEYFHSEKYEIRRRDFGDPRSIAPFMRLVNEARRRHPALQRLRNLRFHRATNDQVLCWSKVSDDGSDVVLMVCTVDAWNVQEATLDLDLEALDLAWDQPFMARDELTGETYTWQGPHPYVRFDPHDRVGHILHVRALG